MCLSCLESNDLLSFPFKHKMCLSCYYVTFYHMKLSHFSKVNVPSYSFHEGLGHDPMPIRLNIFLFSFHIIVVFVPIYE